VQRLGRECVGDAGVADRDANQRSYPDGLTDADSDADPDADSNANADPDPDPDAHPGFERFDALAERSDVHRDRDGVRPAVHRVGRRLHRKLRGFDAGGRADELV